MIVGVPKEIKEEEKRVAMTPPGVSAFASRGHRVLVEKGAGAGSALPDRDYKRAGAELVDDAQQVWAESEMVLKVKEPLGPELDYLRPGLVLFTYLHLAANLALARALVQRKVAAIAYETIQLDDGSLPLLAPMSEVAGRLAVQVGAWCLQAPNGGRGILLSGASGVKPAKVVILGGGIAGASACQVAAGMGAHVSIIDINPARLRYIHDILGGHVTTVMSNDANIEDEVVSADLVIGSVLIPGARAPKLIPVRLVAGMKKGSALVDLSIDQGGCAETARPTSHKKPIFVESGVVHYCVTNMPALVPHTSTLALTNATLSYALAIADRGLEAALDQDAALRRGLNTAGGKVRHPAVAAAMEAAPPATTA